MGSLRDCDLKLSIIIPHYNRKALLFECLESIAENDYPQESYEVLVIDDCTPNYSEEDFCFSKLKNYRVHRLAVNSGGASVPRNFGLNMARGDYILFVDSDDRVSSKMLSKSMQMAIDGDCDLVIIKKLSNRKNAGAYKVIERNVDKIDLDSKELGPSIESFVFGDCYAIGRLMRRGLIEQFGIRFPENLRVNEDLCFCRYFWAVARNAAICASETYLLREAGSDGLSFQGMPREAAYQLLDYIFRNIVTKPNEFISLEKKVRIVNGRMGANYVSRLLDNPHYLSLLKDNHTRYLLALRESSEFSNQSRVFLQRLL